MEVCYGCGKATEGEHPIVGVINLADVDPESGATMLSNPDDQSAFVGVKVCAECHRDPAHRSARPLKCHFFEAQDRRKMLTGLVHAGSDSLQL